MNNIKIIIVGVILISISFYFTNDTLNYLKEKDPIMKDIKKSKNKYHINSENAEIIGNNIISGKKGKTIDYNKSYSKMKRYGTYNETMTVIKEVKPTISIEDNYDKYLIRGNTKSRNISLIFPVTNNNIFKDIINILEANKVSGTFFIDGTILEQNTDFIRKHLSQEYEILSYKETYHPSFFKTSMSYLETITKKNTKYCYTKQDNEELLKLCKKINHHTIKPTILINKNLYQKVKNNLSNGIIISLSSNNYVVKELSLTIDYIKQKGYNIVNLQELLSE